MSDDESAKSSHATIIASIESEIKNAKEKRSKQQGVVRGYVNRINEFMSADILDEVDACNDVLKKLPESLLRFEELSQQVIELLEKNNRDSSDIEEKARLLQKDVRAALFEGPKWIFAVQNQREFDDSSTSADQTVVGKKLFDSDLSSIVKDQSDEKELSRMRLMMKAKDDEIRLLGRQMDHLAKTSEDVTISLQEQMEDLKNAMQQQARDTHDELDKKDENIDRLSKQVRDLNRKKEQLEDEIQTSTPRRGYSAAGEDPPGIGETSMTTGDLHAISTLIGQNNVSVFQKILDETSARQKELYSHISGPKTELRHFNGDKTTYYAFMNSFEELVGKSSRSYTSKLATLLEHCDKSVVPFLDCCNYKPAQQGYEMAKKILLERYGDPYLIAQAWIEKLMAFPKLKTGEQMSQFAAVLGSAHETLKSVGYAAELSCTRTMRDIFEKLPYHVQNKWLGVNRERSQRGRKATLQEMQDLIQNAALEMSDPIYTAEYTRSAATSDKPRKKEPEKIKTPNKKAFSAEKKAESQKSKVFAPSSDNTKTKAEYKGAPCVSCGKDHPTYRCFMYKELSAKERLQFVKDNQLCLSCINPGHKAEDCSRQWKCLMNDCEEPHHYSLHRALSRKQVHTGQSSTSRQDDQEEATASLKASNVCKLKFLGDVVVKPCYMGIRLNPDFALPVVPVVLSDNGCTHTTWALIDTGSAITMIKSKIVNELHLQPVARANIVLQGICSEQDMLTDVVDLSIQGTDDQKKEFLSSVIVNDQMVFGDQLPKEMRRYKEWDHLKHLNLVHHDHNRVDMIIGQDQAFLLVQTQLLQGPNKYYPWGVKTPLGWTMFGHFAEKMQHHMALSVRADRGKVKSLMSNEELDQSLTRMWEIERVPESAGHSPINKRILKRWDKETMLKDGHYFVPIPFKKEPPCMPDNYNQVKQRLDSLTRRLNRDEDLKKQYIEAMKISKRRGILEKAPMKQDPEYLWFSAQIPVLSDTRSTKCRIVGTLNGKCNNVSLNDVVHQGPNLATPLVQVMVSFRVHPYVITGDIEKMFNQVLVPEKQRDCLSILWYKNDDTTQEVEILRNRTQMFGGTWAPAASMYALGRAATDFGHLYEPEVALTVQKNFYVDDLLKSILSISIGIRLILSLRHMLNRVGFNLIKLGSNSMEILDQIPDELKGKKYEAIEFGVGQNVQDSTLGSQWRPEDDVFSFKSITTEKPHTRRGLLSTYASVYEPLGFVGPFVLLAKMIIQELCRLQLPWDQDIPLQYVEEWLKWKEQLPELQNFTVSRWLQVDSAENEDYQLHVFSDASENGYGVVVYLCVLDDQGNIEKANLVMSKCRVAPIQNMTIPRMELTAAVTAAKLENNLVKYLDIPLLPTVFWVDSQIVLFYIKQQSREFKTFVANRIATIHEYTDPLQWRFVPGNQNIADVASRGSNVMDLMQKQEWLKGPSFLYCRDEWPAIPPELQNLDEAELNERKRLNRIRCTLAMKKQVPVEALLRFINCFSQWNRLIRAVALLRRLLQQYVGKKRERGGITVAEYEDAETVVIIQVQRMYLTKKQKDTKSFRNLFPFDDNGVYRVGGRLMLSQLRFEEKHPLIFPCCPQAEMYVRNVHVRLGHPGVDRTSQEVRLRYWMLGGRRYIKEIVNKCVFCKKLKGKFYQQQMAPLPEKRVSQGNAPFEHIGVDYCGPISVKIGRSFVKRYICVITCFQTRAMHLEMAGELSTSSFINALQRFISRRGRPKSIKSDNGTNFVGAKRELNELVQAWNQKQIHSYLLQQHIDWSFNTPGASHHGGVWERQIRSIRGLMMSLIKDQVLSDESFTTYLCVIEEIVNSRPLTKLSHDSQDLLPLTPNHLLMLRQTSGLVGDYERADTLQRRWKQLQFLADLFWKRWTHSYMRDLQIRSKWLTEEANVMKGDLVLVKDEQLPRMSWPLGIVQEVFPGSDGLVRSVKVKTQEGIYERPITKLVPLECT